MDMRFEEVSGDREVNPTPQDHPHIFEHRANPPEILCCACGRPPLFKPVIQARNKAAAKYPSCGRQACKVKIAQMRLADQREKAKRG